MRRLTGKASVLYWDDIHVTIAPAAMQGTLGLAMAQGMMGGMASGFIGGAGGAWLNGTSFWDGLGYGILGGSIGAFSGMVLAGAAHGLGKAWGVLQEPMSYPTMEGAAFAEEYVYTEGSKRYPTGSKYCNNRGCIDMYSGHVEFVDNPGGPYLNFANQRASSIGHNPPALDFAGRGNWRGLAMEFRVLEAGANNTSRGGPHVYLQFKDGARMYITHLSKINRALKDSVGKNIWFKPDTYIGTNDRLLGRIAHRFFHVHVQGTLPGGRDMIEQQIWRYLRGP